MKIIESITTVSISVNEITHKFREQIQKCTKKISFILQNCQRRYKSSQKQRECTHNWSKFIRWLMTSLYTEAEIIESIITVSISINEMMHKFRECTHNWSKFIRWLMTLLCTETEIIESIMTADILIDEITHKFREQIQKCTRKNRSVQKRNFYFFYLNANYSLFDFIVYTTTYLRHHTEAQTKSECHWQLQRLDVCRYWDCRDKEKLSYISSQDNEIFSIAVYALSFLFCCCWQAVLSHKD